MDVDAYRTSPARLARLLLESRRKWEERVAAKQREIRRLRVRVRDLEASRQCWRDRASAAPAAEATPAGKAPASPR